MRGKNLLQYSLLLSLTLLLVIPALRGQAAPLFQNEGIDITSPPDGSTISGVVPIIGSATINNFTSYGLLYASGSTVDGNTLWRQDDPIVWNVTTMVVNGELGQWDTTQVPNGPYVLALAVYEAGNNTPHVTFVNNLIVQNEETTPTPEPTPVPTATPEAPDAAPTAAPTVDAPLIEQPPTATPRATATLEVAAVGEEGEEDGGLFDPAEILSPDAIKEAATLGVQLAFLLYAVGILYVLAKAVVRYYLRQTHKGPQQGPQT